MRRRRDGRYEERFQIAGRRYSAFGNTRDECRRNAEEKRRKIKRGCYNTNDTVTLADFFEEYESRRLRTGEIRKSTEQRDRQRFKRINEFMGNRRVSKIERREVLAMQEHLSKSLTPQGVNSAVNLLRQILKAAVLDGITETNAAANIKPLKVTKTAKSEGTHRALEPEEERLFFQYAQGRLYYPLFRFMTLTGCRLGEASALGWCDIDRKRGVIHIRKTLSRVNNNEWVIEEPKTAAGVRDIPLSDEVLFLLKQQKRNQRLLFGESKVTAIDSLIFTNRKGGYVLRRSVNESIQQTLNAAEKDGIHIPKFSSHSFRDTFASRAHQSGVPLKTIQCLLGHADFSTTMNVYVSTSQSEIKEQYKQIRFAV